MNLDHPTLKTGFAWLALGASLLATVLVSLQVKNAVEQDAVRQFAYASDHIALKIRERLAAQELILRGGAGLFASSDKVTRDDWRRYWDTLRPEMILPGVQGFGFSQVIAPGQLPAHVAQVRREGFPEYAVRPAGTRQAYSSIVYLEPFGGRNLRAFGYDMLSEPVRREAMVQARDTGQATLSGKVQLVQEDGKHVQSGVLMYVPVFRAGMPTATAAQRQKALLGWAYSPYRMRDLMQGMLQDWHGQIGREIHLAVYDGAQVESAAQLYSSLPSYDPYAKSFFLQQRTIDFNGRQWLLVFDRAAGGAPIAYTAAWGVLAGGILISALLFWLGRSLLNTRYHANRIAQSLTADVRRQAHLLKESEYRWNFALDGSSLGVWDWNIADGRVYFSRRWKEMLGYRDHELGNSWHEWEKRVHPDDSQAVMTALRACLEGTAPIYDTEHRMRCKNGRYIWVRDRGSVIVHNADGQPARMIGTFSDITAQKQDALDKLEAEAAARAYQDSVLQAGQRLQKLFEATPVPMQIHAVGDLHITAINQAHERWLGYALQDISQPQRWFERIDRLPGQQEKIQRFMEQSMAPLRLGLTVRGPEATLHSRDGSVRVAGWTMTMVDQDIIVAWTDLTEIRRSEQALRDSEQRFRGMVEQTVSGMYVRRDGRFIYVNPRFCEITGWSADELLGHEVLSYTVADPDNLEHIHQAWARLDAGERNVSYSAPLRRKDGELIELGVNASIITWDDGLPATIVMAQDITARKRAENQIAAYVKQLEASMRGTLDAVSNMVELRDPYTAGHERRVGVIAAAIAREMGWSEERCDNMEMIGLVHDIGKIAVPSEILTKPGRLTPLEMELMKCHAQAGYDILKDVPFAAPVAQAIWQHHERMDGSGYPRGLKGDEILPEARVLAVADVIESMASHRPYRAALGLEVALAEVVRSKGKSYDPDVVDAAVRLVQDKRWVFPQ